ncbi:MAG: BON domain-containing protein [Verrucomicrobiae bacterium]|nr:BON domain-containing protein [Verrucomicrobiae bacterium]
MNTPDFKSLIIAGYLTATCSTTWATAEEIDSSITGESQQSFHDLLRVTEAHVQQAQTANDFINKNVFDRNGEVIGFITDVSLQALAACEDLNLTSGPAPVSVEGTGITKEKSPLDSPSMSYAFLSVGGFLGIGDDLIRLPLNALKYNADRDRFVLAGYLKSEIEAITKNHAPGSEEANSSGKQRNSGYLSNNVWEDYESVKTIRAALAADQILNADQKSGVSVHLIQGKIALSGTVSSEQLKNRAGELAMRNTALEVENDIVVSR